MKQDLLLRLARLETLSVQRECPRLVFIACIEPQPRQALAPGERIVLDYQEDGPGRLYARERITADPNDPGHEPEFVRPISSQDFIIRGPLEPDQEEGRCEADRA